MGRVTVFGSLHYDIMVDAPDRPRKGETVVGQSWHPKCGGKGGNQAMAAAKAGASTGMIGAVGDDDFGAALLANLDRANVARDHVRTVPGAGSGMSVAITDAGGDYGAVIVSGANLALGQADADAAHALLAGTGVLVLQNEVPDAANVAVARAARAASARVLLNAAPARLPSDDLRPLIDILVVNAIEAELLAGLPPLQGLSDALAAARRLAAIYPIAIVTAGGDGVAYADRDGASGSVEALPVTLVSTHGAGDEFVGFLAAAIAAGEPLEAAVQAANAAAARLVSTPRSTG